MRRKREEEHVNHERWAIPYGDLITLLLAFFVVMYAMSAVNEGKYRVMSQSILEAFHGSSRVIAPVPASPDAPSTTAPVIDPTLNKSGSSLKPIPLPLSQPDAAVAKPAPPPDRQQQNLSSIQRQVEQALQPLIDKKQVVIRRTPNWLEIEIRTDILFQSGVARLATPAEKVLDDLGQILAPFPNPLRVEGYTDNEPISTPQFPSNWELSAARAASVARLFAEHGVDPDRLGIMGWGEVRPIADNATADGRNRNRRVLVVVLSDRQGPSRFTSDANALGKVAEAVPPATGADAAAGSGKSTAPAPVPAPATVPTGQDRQAPTNSAVITVSPAGDAGSVAGAGQRRMVSPLVNNNESQP